MHDRRATLELTAHLRPKHSSWANRLRWQRPILSMTSSSCQTCPGWLPATMWRWPWTWPGAATSSETGPVAARSCFCCRCILQLGLKSWVRSCICRVTWEDATLGTASGMFKHAKCPSRRTLVPFVLNDSIAEWLWSHLRAQHALQARFGMSIACLCMLLPRTVHAAF